MSKTLQPGETKKTIYDFPLSWAICFSCKQPLIPVNQHSIEFVSVYLEERDGEKRMVVPIAESEKEKYKDFPQVRVHASCYRAWFDHKKRNTKQKPTAHDKLMLRWLEFIERKQVTPSFLKWELHHILKVIGLEAYYETLDMLLQTTKKYTSRQTIEDAIIAEEQRS